MSVLHCAFIGGGLPTHLLSPNTLVSFRVKVLEYYQYVEINSVAILISDLMGCIVLLVHVTMVFFFRF